MRGKLLFSAAVLLLAAIFALSACGNKEEAETAKPAAETKEVNATDKTVPAEGNQEANKSEAEKTEADKTEANQTETKEAPPTDLKTIAPAGLAQLGELVNQKVGDNDPYLIAIFTNEDQKNSFKDIPSPQNIWANNYEMVKSGRLAIISRVYPDNYKEFNPETFNETYNKAIAEGFFEVVEQGDGFVFAKLATPPDKAGFTAEVLHKGKVYGLYYLGAADADQAEALQKEARAWLQEFLNANPK